MKESFADQARKAGVSVSTLKRQLREKRKQAELDRAMWELGRTTPIGGGWNNRAGCKGVHD